MDLLTVVGQQTLYYSEVSFLSPAFFRVPIFESYRKLLKNDVFTIAWMVSIIIKEWTTKIELVPTVQKRNAAVLLRKPGRLAPQYAK